MKPKKLIRSKVIRLLKPDEYEQILDARELNKLYALKIHEELIEVQKSNYNDLFEFVDLIEVAIAFANANNFSCDQITAAMQQKMQINGTFDCTALINLNPNNPSNEMYFEAAD